MSRFGLLCGRLLERRLLGDGEAHASVIPGAFLTLSLSILVFSLVLDRSAYDVALYLGVACLVWSGVKAFLEADDLEAASLDRAVLEPLPIAPPTLAAARAVVVAVGLLLSTLNLALPVAAMVGAVRGVAAGLLLLLAAVLSSLAGLAFALASRVAMQRVLGGRGMARLEGPIRLVVAVGLFAVVFVAPDFSALLERFPALAAAPPFSFASLAAGGSSVAALVTGALAAVVLLATFRLGPSDRERASGAGRTSAAARLGVVARWFVRDDERGAFEFASANIARDRTFRARSYPLFAFPFAVTILLVQRPEEPTLALLALYGTAVYLSVAQLLFPYTESPGGAALFHMLPWRDRGAFRAGAEKAFLLGVGLPVYVALTVALVVLSLFGFGFPPATALAHAVLGALAGALVTAILFQRIPEPAFSLPDEGAYAKDTNGPMVAILLAALLAVLAVPAARSLGGFVAVAVVFVVALKLLFGWKRRQG